MSVKVLVVDDSILYRRALTEALRSLPDVEVVGSVSNGTGVLPKVRELRPDLLTLDIEMPGMSGIEVMDALRQAGEAVKVLVISSLTLSGGKLTLQALQKGAFDFITKPGLPSVQENLRALREELAPRLRALSHRVAVRNILRPQTSGFTPEERRCMRPAAPTNESEPASSSMRGKPELVVIGVSTGGPNALTTIFSALPGNLGVPILIVQHMPPIFTQLLAGNLSSISAVRVREAVHEEEIKANAGYLAPGGKHMRLVAGPSGSRRLQLTDDPPENSCRPAVNYLFRSVAQTCPGKALAVILTGMGDDGTLGLRLLKRSGSIVIAQDEASCVVFGMPRAAIDAGVVDVVLPLEAIAERITNLVRGSQL